MHTFNDTFNVCLTFLLFIYSVRTLSAEFFSYSFYLFTLTLLCVVLQLEFCLYNIIANINIRVLRINKQNLIIKTIQTYEKIVGSLFKALLYSLR